MEIILVVPSQTRSTSGNWITACRLAEELQEAGHSPRVARADSLTLSDLEQATLVHCLHAYKSGWSLLPLLERCAVPLVITFTGTDLNELEERSKKGDPIRQVLARTAAFVVFHPSARQSVLSNTEIPQHKLWIIPQSPNYFQPSSGKEMARQRWGIEPDADTFLWAGGIRPVKQPLRAIEFLEPLAQKQPRLKLLLAGPVLDPGLGNKLARRLAGLPWARHLGEVPHAAMVSLYTAADVVLNTSLAEGMSNALLEAMSLGKAILAADIPGNRSLIQPGETGLLFGPEDFAGQAELLLAQPELRRSLGERAKALVKDHFSRQREVEAYLELYRRCLEAPV